VDPNLTHRKELFGTAIWS